MSKVVKGLITKELQNKLSGVSDALVADVIVSGRFRVLGGVRWSVGVYNVLDWRYSIPVGSFFASPVMPQLGRTFMANLDLTF